MNQNKTKFPKHLSFEKYCQTKDIFQKPGLSDFHKFALREKCPNREFFLVRIFLYSDWIQENADQ